MKFKPALSLSLGLHLVLGGMLVVSMDFHTPMKPTEVAQLSTPIEAVVIDQQQLEQQVKKIKDQKAAQEAAEQKRIRDLERRAQAAEQRRKDEEKRVEDIEKQKQKQLNDKKRADQAAAEAREKQKIEQQKADQLEKERKRKEEERKADEEKALKAKQKREAEEKALKEAQRKREEDRELQEQEKLLQEQLKAEQAARSVQRQKYVLSEKEKYIALIDSTINQNWIVDDSMLGKTCRVNIKLASSGFVIQAKVLEGDPIMCQAAERAILRAGTLPMSSEPDVYNELKDINLTFNK